MDVELFVHFIFIEVELNSISHSSAIRLENKQLKQPTVYIITSSLFNYSNFFFKFFSRCDICAITNGNSPTSFFPLSFIFIMSPSVVSFWKFNPYFLCRGSAIAKIVGVNAKNDEKFDERVTMYVFEEMINGKKLTEIINETHENVKYLPGQILPANVVSIS